MSEPIPIVRKGALLQIYLLASQALPLLGPPLLRRRLRRGKEDTTRWREKLGEPSARKPEAPVIWMHAVGLGEVLALRGLIGEMSAKAPEAEFLVTSSARSSAQVLARNLPARTRHQFLPLDAPGYLKRFLDHWQPALSIWAEQELWPGAVVAAHDRGVPLAMVNARISAKSYAKRARVRQLYADLLARFKLVSAQDQATACRLEGLGASSVRIDGSLKPAAPALVADEAEHARLQAGLSGRSVWVAASTHPGDETEALLAAHTLPERLLILVPRDIRRADDIASEAIKQGFSVLRRSQGGLPADTTRIWLADSYGEMGLWYRLADAALVGGGFDEIGGHNPWEPAALGAAVLHGPDVRNFERDYATLREAQAARQVARGSLADALKDPELFEMAHRAHALVERARGSLAPLATELLALARLQ